MARRAIFALTFIWILQCAAGCQEEVPCELNVELIKQAANKPANVLAFFQVTSCDGFGVPGLVEENFVLREDGLAFSGFESRHVLLPEQRPFRTNVVLALDVSGSIVDSGNLPDLVNAAKAYLGDADSTRFTGILTFDGRKDVKLLTDFTNDTAILGATLDGIPEFIELDKVAGTYDTSTNLFGAVVDSVQRANGKQNQQPDGQIWRSAVVIFTDGTDRAGYVSLETAEAEVRASEANVHMISLGGELTSGVLKRLGKDSAIQATDITLLENAFAKVSDALAREAGKFYTLSYCSPARSGTHTVEITVTVQGFTGDVDFTFNADDFGANCVPENASF